MSMTTLQRGKHSITGILTRPKPHPDDQDAARRLMQLFDGMPLTFADIKDELGWSEDRTRHAIRLLEAAGEIRRERPDSKGAPDLYRYQGGTAAND